MKLLFISSLLVAATNAADVDRRRINGITFADQAVEALNIVHKGQSTTEQKLVATRKGDDNKSDNKGDDKSSDNSKSRDNKSSSSKSSSSKSGSGSRDGRGVCGESDGYCKDYDSSSFLNFKKEGGDDKGGDSKSRDNKSSDKSSKSSRSSKSSTSSGSRDGSRRTDRCFRACDTDRCTSDDRRRLECPASTAASSDFVQKGQASQASPIQKLVWAAKKGDEGEDSEGGDEPASKTNSKDDDPDNKDDRNNSKSSSGSSKSKSSSSSGNSGDNDRKWSGSGDDICTDAPKDWCEGSSGDGDDLCKDACNKKHSSKYCEKKHDRDRLGCDKTSASGDVAATKKLRGRRA